VSTPRQPIATEPQRGSIGVVPTWAGARLSLPHAWFRPQLRYKILAEWFVWSVMAAVALRIFGGPAGPGAQIPFLVLGAAATVRLVLILRFRLYAQAWKRASFRDLTTVIASLAVGHGVHLLVLLAARTDGAVIAQVWMADALLSFGALAALRTGSRWRHEVRHARAGGRARVEKRVLLIGAGEAGVAVVREMRRHPEQSLVAVGFLDDDPAKRDLVIEGVEVVGSIDDLPTAVARLSVDVVVISVSRARGPLVRRVQNMIESVRKDLPVRVIPGVFELLNDEVSIARLRPVRLDDLLRREAVPVQLAPIRTYVDGACVMVTGAGGSIGSELVRQLTRVTPKQLVLVGCGENSLFEIQNELSLRGVTTPLAMVIADVSNRERLRQVFERWRPTVVFHAAAHKHVPLMEANPEEAFFNNVVGTRNVAELCAEFGVERFVNVSTDKAVNPASVMGASKRMGEAAVKDVAHRPGLAGRFVSVRFGNVLGSRGSVVPVFQRQIAAGGPVKVTDPAMTRYFMTIPEACQLLLQAAANPVHGATYLLDMGSPVRILDLAEQLIRLSGLTPYEDIAIEFTGRRPGEKLHEELTTQLESSQPTDHPHIVIVPPVEVVGPDLDVALQRMRRMAEEGDTQGLRIEMLALFGRTPDAGGGRLAGDVSIAASA
jgi:FlaA1/EpsC-like NDP-sugar epimerase